MNLRSKGIWCKILGYRVGDKVRLKEEVSGWFGTTQLVYPKGKIVIVKEQRGNKLEVSFGDFYTVIDESIVELVELEE